jgi:hypothetical protein
MKMSKWRNMGWAGHVAHMKEVRKVQTIYEGRPRSMWRDDRRI